jgi:GSH-dependent disulfide-bond oxidoreductase
MARRFGNDLERESQGKGARTRAGQHRGAVAASFLAVAVPRVLCCTSSLIDPRGGTVIDLYTWSTPNGRKVSIMLEEVGLPYEVHPIHIGQGEQHQPEFLAISPNNKIPAIVDRDNGYKMFESGAILIYLADKTGQLLPPEGDYLKRMDVIQWLMFQMGGVGPFFGQTHHFNRFAKEKIPYAIERYVNETKRLYGVMDKRLDEVAYLAGDDYSIADVATFPWVARWPWHGLDDGLRDYPNVVRWYDSIRARPAVQRGYDVPPSDQEIPAP